MELADIKDLIANFEKGSIRELKINDGDFNLVLSKNDNQSIMTTQNVVNNVPTSNQKTTDIELKNTQTEVVKDTQDADAQYIKAPLVGSVYLQPAEDQDAFVEKNQHIEKGQTVAIIEAMKMMTEIKAQVSGKLVEVLVKNEEIVEFDKPLFKVISD